MQIIKYPRTTGSLACEHLGDLVVVDFSQRQDRDARGLSVAAGSSNGRGIVVSGHIAVGPMPLPVLQGTNHRQLLICGSSPRAWRPHYDPVSNLLHFLAIL